MKVHSLQLTGRSFCSIRSNRKWCKRRGSSLQCQNCFFVYTISDCNLKNYQNVEIIFDAGTFDAVRNAKKADGLENTLFSFRSSFRYNGNLNVQESKAVTEIRKNDFGATTAADIDQRIEQSYRRLKIKYDKYMNDNDCRPSEAKAHIIGELNNAVSNCLKIKVDNLGNIEADRVHSSLRKTIQQTHLSTMYYLPVKRKC